MEGPRPAFEDAIVELESCQATAKHGMIIEVEHRALEVRRLGYQIRFQTLVGNLRLIEARDAFDRSLTTIRRTSARSAGIFSKRSSLLDASIRFRSTRSRLGKSSVAWILWSRTA
jgi:hypothetical protein